MAESSSSLSVIPHSYDCGIEEDNAGLYIDFLYNSCRTETPVCTHGGECSTYSGGLRFLGQSLADWPGKEVGCVCREKG